MSTSQSRHVYTREQRVVLEASFARQSHPDMHEKERLANLLNCNLVQICNWFQNHRRRMKKQQQITTKRTQPYETATQQLVDPSSYYCYCCYYPSTACPQQAYDCAITQNSFETYYEL